MASVTSSCSETGWSHTPHRVLLCWGDHPLSRDRLTQHLPATGAGACHLFHPVISRVWRDVDGFGEVAGPAGAAAEFAQDAPGLQLGVGSFSRGAVLGVS